MVSRITSENNVEGHVPWTRGTDLRGEDGMYRWPHPFFKPVPDFVCVGHSKVMEDTGANESMRYAERWWTSQYVNELAHAAARGERVPVFHPQRKELVEVPAANILMNQGLPEADGWGKNFGLHWMAGAGAREMKRRADRGTVIHDALEQWAHGFRVRKGELPEYVNNLVAANGFRIPVDYVLDYVRSMLDWADAHVDEILWTEAPFFDFERYFVATTSDIGCTLRGLEHAGVDRKTRWCLDAKGSKEAKDGHRVQAGVHKAMRVMGLKGSDRLEEVPSTDRVGNLYVQPEGVELREWREKEHREGYTAFLNRLMVFHGCAKRKSSERVHKPRVSRPGHRQVQLMILERGGLQ